MKTLYQKKHGLPGMGVAMPKGEKGDRGNGIYIGFINDFFDCTYIETDAIVRMAVNKNHGTLYSGYYTDLNGDIIDYNDTSIKNIYARDIDGGVSYDVIDSSSFTFVYDINSDSQGEYTQIYDYTEIHIDDGDKKIPTYTVKIDWDHITYEHDDLEKDGRTYTPGYEDAIESRNAFYKLDSNGDYYIFLIEENGKQLYYWITPLTYSSLDKYSLNDSTGKYEKSVDGDYYKTHLLYVHKDKFNRYSKLSDYSDYKESDSSFLFKEHIWDESLNEYLEGVNVVFKEDTPEAKKKYYVKTTVKTGNIGNIYSSDSEGYTHVGFDEDEYNPTEDKSSIYKSLYSQYREKKEKIFNSSIINYQLATSLPYNYVKWSEENPHITSLPVSLKEDFKEGDILYFYTDLTSFNLTGKIDYMVVITDEMRGCTLNDLIEYAIPSPFEISSIDVEDLRIKFYDNMNIILTKGSKAYNTGNEENDFFFKKGLDNYISMCNESAMSVVVANPSIPNINFATTKDKKTLNVGYDSSNKEFTFKSKNEFKFDNLYMKNDLFGSNIESLHSFMDTNIILDLNYFIAPLDSDKMFISETGTYVTFKIDKQLYLSSDDYTPYKFGYIKTTFFPVVSFEHTEVLYDENGNPIYDMTPLYDVSSYLEAVNENRQTVIVEDIQGDEIILNVVDDFNTIGEIQSYDASFNFIEYNIILFVRNDRGIKFFSKNFHVKFNIEKAENETNYIASYDESGSADFEEEAIQENTYNNLIFEAKGLNCNLQLYTEMLVQPNSYNFTIDKLYINKQEIPLSENYSDNEYNPVPWLYVNAIYTKREDNGYGESLNQMIIPAQITDNIPNITYHDNMLHQDNSVDVSTISEFMTTLSDRNSIGNSLDCNLFSMLEANKRPVLSKERKALMTVNYTDDSTGLSYTENFYITLPGFVDPRTLPEVILNAHTSLKEMEQANSINNGILSNLVQVFVDVSIQKFDYTTWGKYAKAKDDVLLDLTIENIDNDIDWIDKYYIKHAHGRSTLRMLCDENDILIEDTSISMPNYVSLQADVIKPRINVMTSSVREVDEYIIDSSIESSVFAYDNYKKIPLDNHIVTKDNVEYLILDNEIVNHCLKPMLSYSGISKHLKISLKNLTIDDVLSGTYKIRLILEFGNPIPANFYMRFAVTEIKVKLKTTAYEYGTLNLGFDYGGEAQAIEYYEEFTAKTDLDNPRTSGVLHKPTDYNDTYKYISNPIELMINPLSLVACDIENEISNKISDVVGGVKKYGSELPVLFKQSFYGSSLYSSLLTDFSEKRIQTMHIIPWNSFMIQTKNFQDNIAYISIITNDIDDAILNTHNTENMFIEHSQDVIENRQFLDNISHGEAFNIVYRASTLSPMLRDDKKTIMYNDNLYLASKYSQFENNMPQYYDIENDLQIRTQELIDSMTYWNEEYITADKKYKYVLGTVSGVFNTYGNGYDLLYDSYDLLTYDEDSENTILSLLNVKNLNSEKIFQQYEVFDIPNAYETNLNIPDIAFRTLLYDAHWEFPIYDGKNITPFRLISAYDYLAYFMSCKKPLDNGNALLDGLDISDDELEKFKGHYDTNIIDLKTNLTVNLIPYNFIYNVYPRTAYDAYNKANNILMLRLPSFGFDDDSLKDITKNGSYNILNEDSKYFLNMKYLNSEDI